MNRVAIFEACDRIQGSLWFIRFFHTDGTVTSAEAAIETLGRLSVIEVQIAEIRKALEDDPSGRPTSNVHVLGQRDGSDAA